MLGNAKSCSPYENTLLPLYFLTSSPFFRNTSFRNAHVHAEFLKRRASDRPLKRKEDTSLSFGPRRRTSVYMLIISSDIIIDTASIAHANARVIAETKGEREGEEKKDTCGLRDSVWPAFCQPCPPTFRIIYNREISRSMEYCIVEICVVTTNRGRSYVLPVF